jgi:LuxR family transcriptional regulator, maltose regulon positive regulatory protein
VDATRSPLVPRKTLFDRLSGGAAGGVTLISAPAGSGKTVLLRSWIDDAGLRERVAWVSVERGERDAQRFWLAVIDALSGAVGRDGFVQRLGAAPGFDGEAVVGRLLSDLASLEGRCGLVIDDLHELSSAEALAQLELLLARLPGELRVVLATRRDPQLGLHRLRLAGALTELRAADLRFSPPEARDLLEAAGIELPDAALALLLDRTEGWVAGLRLAAIALAGHPDPERFVAEFSGSERTVADYLLAEVLDRQSPEVRRLLLRTSVLERVSGPLADVLTEGSGSERILQRLEAANAFVVSLDTGRSWFRYHHLFADLLRLELRSTAPDEIGPLHRAAARWFAEHGYVVDAIRHAQAAGEWEEAGHLLFDNLAGLAFDGRGATTRALLAAFPAEVAAGDAELAAVFAGVELETGSLEAAAPHLTVVDRLAPTVSDVRRGHFDVQSGVLRLTAARRHGDLAAVLDEMRSLEAAFAALSAGEIAFGNDVRAAALMDLGVAELWSCRVGDARRHLEEGIALARRIGRPWVEIACRGHLAVEAAERSVALAREESEQAIALAETRGLADNQVVAMAHAAFGGALAWTGRFEEAERSLDRAHALRAEAEPATEVVLQHRRGMLRAGQGRLGEALAAFRAADSLTLASQPFLVAQVRGALLQTLTRMGETAAAREVLDAATEREQLRAASAAVHLAEGSAREAADVLAPALEGSGPGVIPALLVEAAAQDRLGDPRAAEAAVERALELAEPDGIILPFVIAPSRELLERHSRHRTAHATLLADIRDALAGSSPPPRHGEPGPAQEELSDAELRVLRYLPSNLKSHEIAAELQVSVHTVKTHMRHIYAKLDAHSRSKAVARARDLGLLAPSSRLG